MRLCNKLDGYPLKLSLSNVAIIIGFLYVETKCRKLLEILETGWFMSSKTI
ncbi:hypothetical protein JNB11_06450 [Kocuria palustris]|nr:hypothetical protein [Kocuria palustris]